MSFARKMMLLAIVPLLVLGQEAESGDEADKATPKVDMPEGFAPYQTILDRLPFGPLPPNFNPDAPPGTPPSPGNAAGSDGANASETELTEDEQQIVASVRVSILNVTPSGAAAVGFTDSSVQPPVHYYMKVGEKRDVWEVKDADPAEQTVVLLKNGVEATLKVGEGVAGGDSKKKPPARTASPRALARASAREGGGGPAPRMSAMERLRARRRQSDEDLKAEEARREAAAAEVRKNAAQAAAQAAQAAAEREQQREALLQIQEELRRQREEREQRAASEAQEKPQEEAAPVE